MSHRLFSRAVCAFALLFAPAAHAQRTPTACTSTQPATVASGGLVSGVSVVSGPNDTLFVLYDTAVGPRRTVSLLVLSGVNDGSIQTNTFTVGEGSVGRSAITIVGSNVVGAYKRTNGQIAVFSRAITGGEVRDQPLTGAPLASVVPSVASVGRRVMVAFASSDGHVHRMMLDGSGVLVGRVRSATGTHRSVQALGAFGGMALGMGPAQVEVVRGSRTSRLAAVRGEDVRVFSGATVGRGALVLSVQGGSAHIAAIRGAAGAGSERGLGPAVGAAHAALASTDWGGFSLWPNSGQLMLRAVRANGSTMGEAFTMGRFGAVAPEAFAAVSHANVLYAFWGESGEVRMVRMNCY
ncbi:MAG: hypothetical protein Q8Q09_10140 [Deltaproteobacteria bacterium]|nr:hypothetical protein [Deltaproteobacteria bacterium]